MIISPPLMLLVAQMLIPVADQVPVLGVEASCKATTAIAMADSQSYDNCMQDENTARQQLLPIWQSFPASDRSNCEALASLGGSASYVELLVCLQMARDASTSEQMTLKGARKK